MSGFTKVYDSMLDSSVWQLSKETRLLWLTLLMKKDGKQVVRASIPGLAHSARLTIEETVDALEDLKKPDPFSQTPDHEGRRILEVDGGWFIVNGEKYRDMMQVEGRREYQKLWARKKRAQKAARREKRRARTAEQRAAERRFRAEVEGGANAEDIDRVQVECPTGPPGKDGVEGTGDGEEVYPV